MVDIEKALEPLPFTCRGAQIAFQVIVNISEERLKFRLSKLPHDVTIRLKGAAGDAFVFFRLFDRFPFEPSVEEDFPVIGFVLADRKLSERQVHTIKKLSTPGRPSHNADQNRSVRGGY